MLMLQTLARLAWLPSTPAFSASPAERTWNHSPVVWLRTALPYWPLPLFWFRQSYNNHDFQWYGHSSSRGTLKSWFEKEPESIYKPLKAITLQGPWSGCCTQKTCWKMQHQVLVEPFAVRTCNSRKLNAFHQTASVWLKFILATKQKGEGRVLLLLSRHPISVFFEWNIYIFLVLIDLREHLVFKHNM